MLTIQEFIRKAGVSIEDVTRTDAPTNGPWDRDASHWSVTIVCDGRPGRMVVEYHMGSALVGPPDLAGVLDSLAMDSSTFENAEHDYQAWCEEFGYEPFTDDGSRAYAVTFAAVERQATELRELLGESTYERLLWGTERE